MGTFLSDIVVELLFVVESERINIWQRQVEGITAAKPDELGLNAQQFSLLIILGK